MTGAKALLRLFMKIFWAILADCYPQSAFLMKSTTIIRHKKSDGRKRKRGGMSAMQAAVKKVKNWSLVPWLYLSRHMWLIYNGG